MKQHRIYFLLLLLLLVAGLGLVACEGGRDKADVERVQVDRFPGTPPRYSAIATGLLPNKCAGLGRSTQRALGSTIYVTLYLNDTQSSCWNLNASPFRESIRLDVSGLQAGSYAVDVNGAVASFTLTEDH